MKQIIMAFTGVGKSELIKRNSDKKIIDLDTSNFKKKEGWEKFYVNVALAYQELGYLVLICWYGESIVSELNARNANYVLVYPALESKQEYISRFIARNDSDDFVTSLNKNWESIICEIERSKAKNKYILKTNEFLSDYVKQNNILG